MIQRTEQWWKNKAIQEANHIVSAGPTREAPPFIDYQVAAKGLEERRPEMRFAFGKFVELMRRSRGWTMERLASEADLELEDVVMIEDEPASTPEPRAVYQLAQIFEISLSSLLKMAGLSKERDSTLRRSTLRFAARSQSLERLSDTEQQALDEFVSALGKRNA
jgi:HTH-type transcriptional regulator, competence development regulator